MSPRVALVVVPILAALTFASSALAITANPGSQTFVYGATKATVSYGAVGADTIVLRRLVRANGIVVNSWQTGPGSYQWGGKRLGTDTLTVCPDDNQDLICDSFGATATVTWTQFPAIASHKNETSNVARATFANGADVQFQTNTVCNPSGAASPRQLFFFMDWTDAGGPHRFVGDYISTAACTINAQGGYDQTVFGWGRIGATPYPFKIILRTTSDPAHPAEVRFGIGNAPSGLDWDFLTGTLTKGVLDFTPGT
jgi:hypothetical protein